ncbi:MAG: OmpA family protein [Sphingobacteriaceae bacterium]
MKMIKSFTLLITFIFISLNVLAQTPLGDTTAVIRKPQNFTLFQGRLPYRTWSVALHAGALAPVVFAKGSNNDYANWNADMGYGLSVRKQLAHSFGLEFNLLGGMVSGSNKDLPNGVANNLKAFETKMRAVSLLGVVNVATIDFLRKENWINFLVKAGYGQAAYSYALTDGADVMTDYSGTYGQSGDKKYRYSSFVPVGVGVKFKISDHLHFDLGYNMNFMATDFMDGLKIAKTSSDKFSYSYAGVEFSIGKYQQPTLDWTNPMAMMYDDLYLRNDSAELAALKKRVSRVEKDVDDLKCDSDNDGVGDLFDKCPFTPAGIAVSGSGCPLDTDQDSVYDYVDKCPLQKGTKANGGCPEIERVQVIEKPKVQLTPEEEKILQDVFENLEFATGKWIIKAVSFPSLDKLATMLITKPKYNLKISGHTDAIGSEKSNQTLSVNRANAVKTYLVKRGVSKNKIEARGYGESQPVADNNTEEGRQRNRRVEFNIF